MKRSGYYYYYYYFISEGLVELDFEQNARGVAVARTTSRCRGNCRASLGCLIARTQSVVKFLFGLINIHVIVLTLYTYLLLVACYVNKREKRISRRKSGHIVVYTRYGRNKGAEPWSLIASPVRNTHKAITTAGVPNPQYLNPIEQRVCLLEGGRTR